MPSLIPFDFSASAHAASLAHAQDSPKLALKRLAKAAEHPALQFPAARYRLAFSTASLQLAYGKPRLALGTLADLRQTALNRSDWALAAAAGIGRLGICAKEGLWAECRELCAELEAEMSPVPPAATTADIGEGSTGDVFPIPSNPPPSGLPPSLAPQLRAHYLVTVVLALNHLGEGAQCATRVKELHALLDAEGEGGGGADGAMTGIGGGLLEVRTRLSALPVHRFCDRQLTQVLPPIRPRCPLALTAIRSSLPLRRRRRFTCSPAS